MTTAEVWIPLTKGKVTVIDFDDFEKVRGTNWYAAESPKTWYACRAVRDEITNRQVCQTLGRFLMDATPDQEVDHKDNDGLNNRRSSNLRLCTRAQNAFNRRKKAGCSSGYKGVGWMKGRQKWRAGFKINYKYTHLGYFADELEAARAYDMAAIKFFGEYASPNFPKETPNA